MNYLFRYIAFILLILNTSIATAIELQAQIEPIHVVLGETTTLMIRLVNDSNKNIKVTGEPDVSNLQTNFTIYGPSTSQYTQSINGVTIQQVSWQYTLEPQKIGTFTIPAISLQTSEGIVNSQPITMTVGKSNNTSGSPHLTASISNTNPYLYEPIRYTLRLYHLGDISDLEAVLPEDGVLTETLPDSIKKTTEVVDGQAMDVLEVSYLLTPLRSGELQLTPGKIKGLKLERTSRRQHSDIDFFFGYTNSRPFTLSSDPITLQVKAPETEAWLPASDLQITEKWETDIQQAIQAGTPIIRTITITTQGTGGQPLSSLDNLMQDNADFKIRAPKPESKRTFVTDEHIPVTETTQTFSIIPLHAGTLHLPTIKIPWWNLKTNQAATAELPAQTLHIVENQTITAATSVPNPITQVVPIPTQPIHFGFSLLQYGLLITSLIALGIALIFSMLQQRSPRARKTTITTPVLSYSTFKSRLHATENVQEIIELLQIWANVHWQLPVHSTLGNIGSHVMQHYEQGAIIAQLLKELDAAAYGQHNVDLKQWRIQLEQVLPKLKAKPVQVVMSLAPLNP